MGTVAKAWGLSPIDYLSLPKRVRQFCEMHLLAEHLKQEAAREHHDRERQQTQDHAVFDQQASAWEQQIKKAHGKH